MKKKSKAQWPKWNKGSPERKMASHPINDDSAYFEPVEYVKRPRKEKPIVEQVAKEPTPRNPLKRPKLLGVWQPR